MERKEWFYARDNQQDGPVTESELHLLAHRGEIDDSTLLWKEGMSSWSPAKDIGLFTQINEPPLPEPAKGDEKAVWYYSVNNRREGPVTVEALLSLAKSGTIDSETLVWKEGMEHWIKAGATELKPHLKRSSPPPLPGNFVNNSYIWLLAFAPLIGAVLEYAVAYARYGHKNDLAATLAVNSGEFWYVTFILNSVIAITDERMLNNAGYDTKNMIFWALFIVPVYIYQRLVLTKQPLTPLIVWVLALIVSSM